MHAAGCPTLGCHHNAECSCNSLLSNVAHVDTWKTTPAWCNGNCRPTISHTSSQRSVTTESRKQPNYTHRECAASASRSPTSVTRFDCHRTVPLSGPVSCAAPSFQVWLRSVSGNAEVHMNIALLWTDPGSHQNVTCDAAISGGIHSCC